MKKIFWSTEPERHVHCYWRAVSVFRDYISVIHLNSAEDQLSCSEILLSTKGYKNFLDHSITTMRVSTVSSFSISYICKTRYEHFHCEIMTRSWPIQLLHFPSRVYLIQNTSLWQALLLQYCRGDTGPPEVSEIISLVKLMIFLSFEVYIPFI